ncbi:MAG TPA: hypothetical protein O0Y06_07995 [Methanocorpusculum sp.]|nr:hypothetical protein [Methanocorpusculum sp.]HJK80826.1 hypothetical protein [Methanocorpusculum sp.]
MKKSEKFLSCSDCATLGAGETSGYLAALPNLYRVLKSGGEYEIGDLLTPKRERSTFILPADELQERVKELERQIQYRPRENLLAVDRCGNVIMHTVGAVDHVSMNTGYWNAAAVITHNHPSGATLSGTDISQLFNTACPEIRACAGGLWYSIQKEDGCRNYDPAEIDTEFSELLHSVDVEALIDATENNGLETDIDEEKQTCAPVQPESMTYVEFRQRAEQARGEHRILRVVRLHLALKEHAPKVNLIYKAGEL